MSVAGPPRLPREIEGDPCHAAVQAALAADRRPLWSGGTVTASVVPFSLPLRAALTRPPTAGQLVRGLERAADVLAAEARGLAAIETRGSTAAPAAGGPGGRVSRLLLLADDGAERFYRQAERLVITHAPRVHACRLACDAAALGALLFGPGAEAKLVLTAHKHATAAILRALAAGS